MPAACSLPSIPLRQRRRRRRRRGAVRDEGGALAVEEDVLRRVDVAVGVGERALVVAGGVGRVAPFGRVVVGPHFGRAAGDVDGAAEGRADALAGEDAGEDAGDDEGDDPAEGGLAEDPLVDAAAALEERDAGGGADLAVGGRERDAEVRPDDDDDGGAELDGEPARRRDDGELDADRLDDLVAVEEEAETDADAAEGEDPVLVVVLEVRLLGALPELEGVDVRVDCPDGHEGAHRIGHVVGAVRERVADGGEDLDVLEDGLRLRVELLGVVVDRRDDAVRLLLLDVVHVAVDRVGDSRQGLAAEGRRRLRGRLGLLLGLLRLAGLGVLVRKLRLDALLDREVERDEGDGEEEADAAREAQGDPAVDLAGVVVLGELPAGGVLLGALLEVGVVAGADPDVRLARADLLADALGDDEEGVDPDGEPDEDGVELDCTHEGVLRPEDDAADDGEEGDGEEAREEGREDPRQHDAGDAAREVLSAVRVGVLVPRDAGGALGGDGHADEAADAGVGGRDGHLELGGDEEPNADRADDAEVAVHQDRLVHVRLRVALVVGGALADGLGDRRAGEDGAGELEDDGEEAGLLDGERLGAHRGGVGVGDVVGSDAKGGEDGGDGAEDDDPLVLLQRVHDAL
mmetsp:Transcript_18708/g.60100  ORF Transcript_18708/g.60100 Transcript_18708/m.60100 type:complete len:632 (+) Transcript_18708:589-2484(+)